MIVANDPRLSKWCLWGFWMILFTGSFLHSLFPLTGKPLWMAWLTPVNESVWEHLKMGFYGVLLYAIPEYFFLKGKVHNYLTARIAGTLIINLTVLATYYTYTSFTKSNYLWADIASFVLGCALCQWFSCRMFRMKRLKALYNIAGIILLVTTMAVFAYFTWEPPHLPIFRSQKGGVYGIPPD